MNAGTQQTAQRAPIGQEFAAVMEALSAAIAEETDLIAAGRLRDAGPVWERKAEIAGRYLAEVVRLKEAARALPPAERLKLGALAARQQQFRAMLEKNLAVLATAHAVSEGLIRGAAAEISRKAAPDTYGARGRAMPLPAKTAQPVALSRSF